MLLALSVWASQIFIGILTIHYQHINVASQCHWLILSNEIALLASILMVLTTQSMQLFLQYSRMLVFLFHGTGNIATYLVWFLGCNCSISQFLCLKLSLSRLFWTGCYLLGPKQVLTLENQWFQMLLCMLWLKSR